MRICRPALSIGFSLPIRECSTLLLLGNSLDRRRRRRRRRRQLRLRHVLVSYGTALNGTGMVEGEGTRVLAGDNDFNMSSPGQGWCWVSLVSENDDHKPTITTTVIRPTCPVHTGTR